MKITNFFFCFQRSVFALGRILCLILEDYEKTYLKKLTNEDFLSIMKAENLEGSSISNDVLGASLKLTSSEQ